MPGGDGLLEFLRDHGEPFEFLLRNARCGGRRLRGLFRLPELGIEVNDRDFGFLQLHAHAGQFGFAALQLVAELRRTLFLRGELLAQLFDLGRSVLRRLFRLFAG